MPNLEPGHEQPKITVLFGPFSANEDFFSEEAYKDLNLKRKKYTILQVVQDVCN